MIRKGSKVKIHYTLRVDDEIVDSSEGREPLAYVQGGGEIIPGLEEQLEGLATGDKKNVTVAPERGYGERSELAVHKVPKTAFHMPDKLNVGDFVSGQIGGNPFRARVTAIEEEDVTLDLNHPLAGKTLRFEVEVVEVE